MVDSDSELLLPHISICGLGEVHASARKQAFSHVISIWGAGCSDDGPDEVRSFFPSSSVRVLRFDDIEVPGAGAVTVETIRDVLEFGAGLTASDSVLVHCLAGVSRSPGVAFALACQFAGPGGEAEVLRHLVARHPWIRPNRRVVHYSDELLQREGRMNTAVSAIYVKFMGQRAEHYRP